MKDETCLIRGGWLPWERREVHGAVPYQPLGKTAIPPPCSLRMTLRLKVSRRPPPTPHPHPHFPGANKTFYKSFPKKWKAHEKGHANERRGNGFAVFLMTSQMNRPTEVPSSGQALLCLANCCKAPGQRVGSSPWRRLPSSLTLLSGSMNVNVGAFLFFCFCSEDRFLSQGQ